MTARPIAVALVIVVTLLVPGRASAVCELPSVFALKVEERPLVDARGGGLVVVGATAPSTQLRAGDVIRQANGQQTRRCRDLEAAAAEAAAKGLLLLLAVERDTSVFAVALADTTSTTVVAAAPAPAVEPPAAAPRTVPQAAAPPVAAVPVPTAVPTPIPLREATLPARTDASAELTAKATAAAAVLGTVDEAARFAVPVATYARRIEEATNAIAALRIEGEGSGAVRDVVAEAVAYHQTAHEIRRYKATELVNARVDQRGAGAVSLPYFSDSEVPRWIERYPFLSESLQQAPRSTHLLLPGEMAGRWNPDQAVELLWERAAKTAARLAAWGAGSK